MDELEPESQEEEEQEAAAEQELMSALRAALRDDGGKNGVLVLGPSGSGKTGLVRRCIAKLGCGMDYGNALTVRGRTYFADMDPQESGYSGGSFRDFFSGTPSPPAVLVVDDLDNLVHDMNQGLDGLLKLLAAPRPPVSSSVTRKRSSSVAPPSSKKPARRVCVCIATSRHKSDKRLLDVYRRCTEVRVGLPRHWVASRGAARRPPAAVERTLYPLVHDLLTRPMLSAAAWGLSEPDKVTVGLLVHENVHHYRGPDVSDATLAAIAHDHASADAIGTLPHQAQTWHLWELCFLLRTYRTNLRLFPPSSAAARHLHHHQCAQKKPVFTKLLTRCSTEVGTRAFLTDMCFRLGCAWHELLPRLAVLDAEYTDLVSRPAPQEFLACLRQCHSAAPPASGAASGNSGNSGNSGFISTRATSVVARMEWLRMRLCAQLVPHQGTTYCPELSMAEVRRMYRCLRGESAAAASSSSSSFPQKKRLLLLQQSAKKPRVVARKKNVDDEQEEDEPDCEEEEGEEQEDPEEEEAAEEPEEEEEEAEDVSSGDEM